MICPCVYSTVNDLLLLVFYSFKTCHMVIIWARIVNIIKTSSCWSNSFRMVPCDDFVFFIFFIRFLNRCLSWGLNILFLVYIIGSSKWICSDSNTNLSFLCIFHLPVPDRAAVHDQQTQSRAKRSRRRGGGGPERTVWRPGARQGAVHRETRLPQQVFFFIVEYLMFLG